ncbi:MAG TPA: NAD(P)/FAD-dependent oxidoreductase [Thermoanaerobaculia bacterium]|nr:NAD(P)/FAD-dependent oxidoreductase [Thermoanaerobaculia bacterium]
MDERSRADVVVIGAGPAGSILAAILARRGADVVLADRDRFPRDKVCGEFLSWDAIPILDRLGLTGEIDRLGATRITRCRIASGEAAAEIPLPARARGISRLRFDALLLENARRCGAHVLEGWSVDAVGRTPHGQRVELTSAGGGRAALDAPVVAGAWGRWGRLDLRLGRAFTRARRDRWLGFKRHYAAGATDPDAIELHAFPGGYLGAQMIEEETSNVCGLVHQRALAGLRGGWSEMAERLRARGGALARLFSLPPAQEGFLASEPLIFRGKEPVHEGLFLVGDAAGLIDPLTGNGMAMGIQSAALAAGPILEALDPARRRAALESYAGAHRRMFVRRLRWSRTAALMLARPALLAAAIRAGKRTQLGDLFVRRTRASEREIERLAASL